MLIEYIQSELSAIRLSSQTPGQNTSDSIPIVDPSPAYEPPSQEFVQAWIGSGEFSQIQRMLVTAQATGDDDLPDYGQTVPPRYIAGPWLRELAPSITEAQLDNMLAELRRDVMPDPSDPSSPDFEDWARTMIFENGPDAAENETPANANEAPPVENELWTDNTVEQNYRILLSVVPDWLKSRRGFEQYAVDWDQEPEHNTNFVVEIQRFDGDDTRTCTISAPFWPLYHFLFVFLDMDPASFLEWPEEEIVDTRSTVNVIVTSDGVMERYRMTLRE